MARPVALLVLLLLAGMRTGSATTISGLFDAEVAVADQSAALRSRAVNAALRQVLTKLTGSREAPDRVALAPVLKAAENYVQQYRYTEVELPATGSAAPPRKELRIQVGFDEAALTRDLRELGVAMWGSERPSTLTWMVIGNEGGRSWISGDDQPELSLALTERAQARGIALLPPLLDLQDTATLQPSDVWGGFTRPILQASERYQADTILFGALESPTAGIWEARWTLLIKGETSSWTTEGDSAARVLEEGIDGLADLLAARWVPAAIAGSVSDIEITVTDVSNVEQYARVLKYLQSLNSVGNVAVTSVEPGRIAFVVSAHGGEAAVDQAIVLGRVLERLDSREHLYRLLP